MVETPPSVDFKQYFKLALEPMSQEVASLVDKINDKYEYWSDVKYEKLPEGTSAEQLWALVKFSRITKKQVVWPKYNISLSVMSNMQRLCHEFDMNFGGSWGSDSLIPQHDRQQYLVSSLMEEAISSSQMEGASTTRQMAKEMLRKELSPRDLSQQMIHNNYQTIRFIVQHKHDSLTPELLLQVHALMTEKTLERQGDAGRMRTTNDIVVEDGITHQIVHTPPEFTDIPEFVESLCEFFNESRAELFIHPIVRGIIIHFMIAYVHPFVDGNGRTARALFYWYMLSRGYWLTEYMSISRVIAKSKKSYEKAYLHTEADNNDIGYFVAYNLRILQVAFNDLQQYIRRKAEAKNQLSTYYHLGNINPRQANIIHILDQVPQTLFTIKELQNRFSVTHTTAKNDINSLVERGLVCEIQLNKVKKGYVKGSKFDELIESLS
ncbi:MAG: Fic family protein [Mucinivorans sp.]